MSDSHETRDPDHSPPPAAATSGSPWWTQPQRCRDRVVRDAGGARVGHIDLLVRAPDDGEAEVFCLLVLGSVSRLGNEVRAVPAHLLAEDPAADAFVLLCDHAAVKAAPIHVEGPRCACSDWFARVRSHYEGFAAESSPSGKTPHSSSP